MRKLIFLFLAVAMVLSACAIPGADNPQDSSNGTPSAEPTAAEIGSPTATIDWFPATATWTPFPTIEASATPQLLLGLGAQVYQDDFSDLKKWTLAKTESSGGNSIILDRNRLTLAANIPPAALFSLNNSLLLTNFYAEITVSVNRCYGPDTYGMLFRASTGAYAYRFLLNCSGMTRLEQVRAGKTLPLQDWLPSGDAPSGAPGLVTMGVWVSGVEMRFFLNGRYQFGLINPVFKNGTLGVYANALSPNGLNISFSNLTIHSVSYVSPTPTATPSKTPTPTRTRKPTP